MDTLTELEAAVDRLSLPEQEQMLRHLTAKVRRCQDDGYGSGPRADWMRRLAAFRASGGPPVPSVPGDRIVSELRGE